MHDPGAPEGGDRRRWVLFLAIVAVIVALACFMWYLGSGSGTVDQDYSYSYAVSVSNVSSDFMLVLPVPVLEGGGVIPHLDFSGVEEGELNSTPGCESLEIRGDGRRGVHLTGEHHVREGSREGRLDGTPLLSMCSLDHAGYTGRPGTHWLWVYSSVAGMNVSLEFSSGYMRHREGPLGRQWVPGGSTCTYNMEVTTRAGWHRYPVEFDEFSGE